MSSIKLSFRLWLFTNLAFATGFIIVVFLFGVLHNEMPWALLAIPAAILGSIPALIVLMVLLPVIKRTRFFAIKKWHALLTLLLLTCLPYGLVATLFNLREYASFDVWQ